MAENNTESKDPEVPNEQTDPQVNGAGKPKGAQDGIDAGIEAADVSIIKLNIKLPHEPFETSLMCSTNEQVQDIRQSIIDQPVSLQYSCFHLEHNGKRINDFVELSDVQGIDQDPKAELIEDPYTESQARMHFVRIRDLIGAYGDQIDYVKGLNAGSTLLDTVAAGLDFGPTDSAQGDAAAAGAAASKVVGYDFDAPGSLSTLVQQQQQQQPKTLKSIALSHWNPPPYHLRTQGHLLYLLVTTLEGEHYHITSHITGFFVNNSSNHKFDPAPRTVPRPQSAHSLLTLLKRISPSFDSAFQSLQEHNQKRDPLSTYHVSNAIPASPWLVSSEASSVQKHQPDIARSQNVFLLAGSESADTMRDWNEEFQATRELPQDKIQDRVFRERLTSKLFAEYNNAAVKGAIMVARGEVAPLNPTEPQKAQISVYNNVFYSFGADGVGTFAADGGDEAARVAIGKDVRGVRTVNQFDINGLFTPATIVVDYLGKRIVAQGIVPGIFKQREPGEHQIDYGGVEGKDVVAEHEGFKKPFAELSKALHVKKHPVWDKELVRHDLEGSVETKGFFGTDGRKYVLDLYRMAPLDIAWLDQYRHQKSEADVAALDHDDTNYPHRMAVLRPELIESYWRTKLSAYVVNELESRKAKKDDGVSNGAATRPNTADSTDNMIDGAKAENADTLNLDNERVDVSGFDFALNPDVFCGQQPQTEEDMADWKKDEEEVRAVCTYLTETIIPQFVKDIREGDAGFPMDGRSLTTLLHKRGINLRYLGHLARLTDTSDPRLQALKHLIVQEIVSRAFKHVANRYLSSIPPVFANSCVSHMLNCLLGTEHNPQPKAFVDRALTAIYPHEKLSYSEMTPTTLRLCVAREAQRRFAYDISGNIQEQRGIQMLREVSLKLGLQLEARDYAFVPATDGTTSSLTNGSGHATAPNGQDTTKVVPKKKKKANHTAPVPIAKREQRHTFEPEDIINIVPIVKEASPRSILAEEALEGAQISIKQGQKGLGQELLLESLSLHEQIYGILHRDVGRAYYTLSSIYFSLDEKNAALELARKAVIVFERTLGLDHAETVLGYLNLSLFEHHNGNTVLALGYIRHALNLWKVIYGRRHPDTITTINNAAVMLQSMKQYHESRIWFEASLGLCGEMSGTSSINYATLLFQYSQSLALDRDAKAAVLRMREAYTIFKNELGPEDRNTKEAETWLENLTQNAVSMARQAKDIESRRLLLRSRGPTTTLSPVLQNATGRGSVDPREASVGGGAAAPAESRMGSSRGQTVPSGKSIDELLKYINAGSGEGKSKTKKKLNSPATRR